MRDGRPQSPEHRRRDPQELRHGAAPVLGDDSAQCRAARDGHCEARAQAAVEGAVREHGEREQRSGDQDGEALHGRLRGRRPRRLVARRDGQRRLRVVCKRSQRLRSGHARYVRAAGAQCVPLPDPPLPRSMRPDMHECRVRALRHAIDGGARRGHRRAGYQRRRGDRSARGVLRRAPGRDAQARHAADLRRGANGVRSPGPLVRRIASARDARPLDGVEDARRRNSARRRHHQRFDRGDLPRARLCVLHVARIRSPAGDGRSRRARHDRGGRPAAAKPRAGRLSRRELADAATASRGDRGRARHGAAARHRARQGSPDARALSRAWRTDHPAMSRARPEHEHSPASRARLGVAHRTAADGHAGRHRSRDDDLRPGAYRDEGGGRPAAGDVGHERAHASRRRRAAPRGQPSTL